MTNPKTYWLEGDSGPGHQVPTMSTEPPAGLAKRCEAAHRDDSTPCVDALDAVVVLDVQGIATWGCEHHAARLLASLRDGRVHPGSSDGAAIRVHTAAQNLRPWAWLSDGAPCHDHPLPAMHTSMF